MKRLLSIAALLVAASACSRKTPPPAPEPTKAIDPAKLAAFAPLPERFASEANPITPAKVELGRRLFFDTRLSLARGLSCNSCHGLDRFGVDGEKVSTGHKRQTGTRNSPSVYDAAGQVAQFWDGRAPDVETQATMPIRNPIEMAMPDETTVVKRLSAIPEYRRAFADAFPGLEAPTFDAVGKAIGAFERTLVTPSRWDDFLRGNASALTDDEKLGFETFSNTGCPTCHNGALVGGGMFQKLGLVKPWPDTHDQGRYEVTKLDADRMVFKVPSLRNVAKTAPYVHDGSVATLDEAVRLMARHQLGKELADADVKRIVDFLGALTGKLPDTAAPEPYPDPKAPKPTRARRLARAGETRWS